MADLRIVDAPDLPLEEITDEVKIPTGGKGNYAIKAGDVATFVESSKDLANKTFVNSSSNGVKALLDAHKNNKENPHNVTKDQIGLGNVNNTADLDKPVSNATSAAIITANQGKADKTELLLKADKTELLLKADKADLGTASGYDVEDLPITQKQRDEFITGVASIENLRTLKGVKNKQTVKVDSHYSGLGVGGGVYEFEQMSSKPDNGGAWVASSAMSGTWVLISKLHFENFGVINDGRDQSDKIQNAINFILENNIKLIEFEKTNEYAMSKHVSFYQEARSAGQFPSKKIIVRFNGARLRLLTENQAGIEVVRDYIRLENPSFISSVDGCVGIHNGLIVDNDNESLRRSSQFMELISPCTEFLDTAVRFVPNKKLGDQSWGSYYFTIADHGFRSTKIGFDFANCPSADNSTTRVRIFGGTHLGGSCTFLCNNVETLTAIGYASEMLLTPDDRLPDSAACTIYMPFSPDNAETVNGYSVFDGTSENCTRHYNVSGAEVDVLGRYLGFVDPYDVSMIKANNTLNTRGVEGSLMAVGRGSDPAKSPKILMRRYVNSSPNGGSSFGISEVPDGSGFRLNIDSNHVNWKGELQLNATSLVVPAFLKPRQINEDIIEFKSKLEDKFFQVMFTGAVPTLWGGTSWNVHGFNVNPLLDNTTSLGSGLKRYKGVHSENFHMYPPSSAVPTAIGELTFELTSDTQLTIKVKGSDQIVRSTVLNLTTPITV